MDLLNKRVSVYPLINGAVTPKVSTIIVGQVGNSQSDNVLVRIFKVGKKKILGNFSGILHISDAQDRYVNSMNDVCKTGDLIRAKVISEKNQIYHLSTADKNLGVLYAICSRCGNLLEHKNNHEMQCPRCKNIEYRKIAPEYGLEVI